MKKILMKKIKNYFLQTILVYIKMVNKYYQKHKQKWQEKALERYQNLSEEEKDKRKKKGARKISKFY